jgi:hypothetical protein
LRLDVEGELREDAKGTESDHSARERAPVTTRERHDLPAPRDELQRRDGGGQVAAPVAGAVGGRAHCPHDGELHDGRRIREREPALVQERAQLVVSNPRGHCHGARARV